MWIGIITGVALGLSPALSGAVSIASALVGVTLVVAVGGRLQQLIYRSRKLAKRRERLEGGGSATGSRAWRCRPRCSRDRSWQPSWRWHSGPLPSPCCCGCSPAWCSGAWHSPEVLPWASRYSGPSQPSANRANADRTVPGLANDIFCFLHPLTHHGTGDSRLVLIGRLSLGQLELESLGGRRRPVHHVG